MKKLTQSLLLFFCLLGGIPLSAQVIDLSTGISNTSGTMLPVGAVDDTWTVALPGANLSNPASFQSAGCGLNTYSGSSPNVRWLYPAGYSPSSAPMGEYYYKTTFDLTCEVASAQLNFAHIGADDIIREIIVNGVSHAVGYGFSSWGINTTIPVTGELVTGTNTILVHVYNWGTTAYPQSPTGLEIEGNLTVVPQGPNAAFSLNSNGTSVQVVAMGSGTHTWEVYTSATGNQGSYNLEATYYTPELDFKPSNPCYLIQHTVTNECGTSCAAQSICNLSCKKPCDLEKPDDLKFKYNKADGIYEFSWNNVPGATSYILEIIWNDPKCCGGKDDAAVWTESINVRTNSYQMDLHGKCFSWTVKALCADGLSVSSERKCEDGDRVAAGKAAAGTTAELIRIFPNPAKESVSFNIAATDNVSYTISVTDINGRIVKTFEQNNTNGNANIDWNTASLSKGIYIVKMVTSDKRTVTKKLVIE